MSKRPRMIAGMFALLSAMTLTVATQQARAGNEAASLDQARNGGAGSPVNPVNFQNGNVGASTGHMVEGYSIPYRMILTGMTAGQHTLVIQWDTTHNSKHAIDYITHYNRLEPHTPFGHDAETVDPVGDLSGVNTADITTTDIPAPGLVSPSVGDVTGTSFAALTAGEKKMTAWGLTVDALTYTAQDDSITVADASTTLQIDFTVHNDGETQVLAWGGHIASAADWGNGNSSGGISGSPYHTRLISLDGSGGNQDRSLAAGAVLSSNVLNATPLAVTASTTSDSICEGGSVTVSANPSGGTGQYSYAWTKDGGTTVVSTDSSITFNPVALGDAGTYAVTISDANNSTTTPASASTSFTVKPKTTATSLQNVSLCLGGTATFTTTATNASSYTWTFSGSTDPLAGTLDGHITIDGGTLTITNVGPADVGTYSVTANGDCNSPTSSATLTLKDPTATTDPADLTKNAGDTATFTTTASGEGPFTFVWKKGSTVLSDGDLGGRVSITTDGATSTLSISNVGETDPGTYCVTATGACNSDAQSATLVVTPVGQIAGAVYFDPDVSGNLSTGDSNLSGWTVSITRLDASQTIAPATTSGSGYSFTGLWDGTYQITETVTNGWSNTSVTTLTVVISGGQVTSIKDASNNVYTSADFFDVKLGAAAGGHTIGFWSNKNGASILTKDSNAVKPNGNLALSFLSNLNLVGPQGKTSWIDFDPTSVSAYQTWVLNATATNMAYMLSAQLSASELNVREANALLASGFTGNVATCNTYLYLGAPSAVTAVLAQQVTVVSTPGGCWVRLGDVMSAANTSLGLNKVTIAASQTRDQQDAMKRVLDAFNNNQLPYLAGP